MTTLAERYELGEPIGRGGMAKVFRATDTRLGRTVAIKVLAPEFARNQDFVQRFQREATAAARLNNPNIVGVYDSGSAGDVHFMVMEYVEGRTLAEVLVQDGRLLPERAMEIADHVAQALTAAAAAGIVHRDIKPGNIMLTADGQVKVMDFGIARMDTGQTVAQTQAVMGTASYLSPEQAQGSPLDTRSDLYSLGVVLYEMLTGRPPFSGDTAVSVAMQHVQDSATPPSQVAAGVPPALDAVVMRALAKNPANRYQSAEEFRHDLEKARLGQQIAAPAVMPSSTTQVLPAAGAPELIEPPSSAGKWGIGLRLPPRPRPPGRERRQPHGQSERRSGGGTRSARHERQRCPHRVDRCRFRAG
jgi:serine/threonine protein kinase